MKTREILKRLLRFVGTSKLLLIISFISALLSVLCNVGAPLMIGITIDRITQGQPLTTVFSFIMVLALLYILYSLCNWVMMYATNKIAFSSSCTLRKQLYDKLDHLPISFFDTTPRGDLISRFINDIDLISDGLLQGLSTLLSGVATIVAAMIAMFFISWQMACIVFVSAPFTYFVAKTITTRTQKYFRQQATSLGHLNGYSEEILSQIKTVKAYHYEERAFIKFKEINQELYTAGVKSQYYGSLANPSTRFVMNCAYTIVGMSGAAFAIMGTITIGNVSSFLIYSNLFSKPFNEITGVITQIQSAIASSRRIFQLFDLEEETKEDGKLCQHTATGHVTFNDVSFAYDTHKPFIEHLQLTVDKGAKIAIVGRTGAGKTTFVNLLMRFYDVTSGCICIDGINVKDMTRDCLRTNFGMVLQDTYVFEDSIANNISYGRQEATREEIIQAAKKTGAHDFITCLQNGYDTLLHTNSNSLSLGQRQLLSITRVLLMNPAILILDEATSSIDTRSEHYVNQAMEYLMKNKTSFVIAHRLSTILNADCILVMEQGTIIEQGTHDELLAQKGAYHTLYTSQFL